jgi:hypothetical protein
MSYRKPDFMLNAKGQTVRFHVPHPIVPAVERFMALVRSVACADDAEDDCWQWIGGDTFRVDDLTVTTPQRFIYVVHFNVTEHPTAAWTARQLIEAFPEDTAPRFLIRDRDSIYGHDFQRATPLRVNGRLVVTFRPNQGCQG